MTVYSGDTPNGPIRIFVIQISYDDLEGEVTVWRARTRYGGREYDVGGSTEDEAYQNLIKMLTDPPPLP